MTIDAARLVLEYTPLIWAGVTGLIVFSLIVGVYDFIDKGRTEKQVKDRIRNI